MENNKKVKPNRTLLILRYLWENTDELHYATIASINSFLEPYGLAADRSTISGAIEQLIDFGVDIDAERGVQMHYFIRDRVFKTPEVKLLVDAVQSSRFITPKKSKELIKKLSIFVESHSADILKRQLYVDDRSKADNESIYTSVDHIQNVINDNRKISFKYYEYTPEKKKILKHGGQLYVITPYALLWNNDCYYVVGFSDVRGIIQKFRIDRMSYLKVLDEKGVKKPKDFKISDFFTKEFSMLHGIPYEVELLCENQLMDSIVDRFGTKINTSIVDEKHFKLTASIDLSSNFYGWVFASGGAMKILGPAEVVDGFNRIIELYYGK